MALIRFDNGFHGIYKVKGQTLEIGTGGLEPYDMTYGAIGSCLFSTLLKVAEEQGITLSGVEVLIEGRKRQSVPAMVEYLKIRVYAGGDTSEDLQSCLQEACEKCSMVSTFAKVAEIDAKLSPVPLKDGAKTACSLKRGEC